ncbi:MAG: hypothetical protein A3J93_00725 [Candidatus Magasanikbacteria bacterium RIFOXYC2_FULL_42_28]|uniref:Uncharacterized protein n=1 Tax=Candidatus Magasanikbacteria bacterium RIFOXYC2_FULL_42_28 TaxID=1798704 RepID=A0A1F6NXF5_9BACT|nr:MAG: hypothetical protein A3J93_00725 [Candidatus Magasanikbacteria bacterium RIFOXYC2_FULL_42_28]
MNKKLVVVFTFFVPILVLFVIILVLVFRYSKQANLVANFSDTNQIALAEITSIVSTTQLQPEKKQMTIVEMEDALKELNDKRLSIESFGAVIYDPIIFDLAKIRYGVEVLKNPNKQIKGIQCFTASEIQDKLTSLSVDLDYYNFIPALKKRLSFMRRDLLWYKHQLENLIEKRGVAAPAGVKENLAALDVVYSKIQGIKEDNELLTINVDNLKDLVAKINISRPALEYAVKWARVLKSADESIVDYKKRLVTLKTTVDDLAVKNFDVSPQYNLFQTGVSKLVDARDASDLLYKNGKAEDALNKIDADFFKRKEIVNSHGNVISYMNNLGEFDSHYQSNLSVIRSEIKRLNNLNAETAGLQSMHDQMINYGSFVNLKIGARLNSDIAPTQEDDKSLLNGMVSFEESYRNAFSIVMSYQPKVWVAYPSENFPLLNISNVFVDFFNYKPGIQ